MNTLSYGYKQPVNTDTGDVFFPALSDDIALLNNHTHDGITSAPLGSQSQSILAANWTAAPIGGGLYVQLITLPLPVGLATPLSFDTCQIWFKLSTGQYVYPSVERVSATTYNVFINDNSLTLTAFYR